MASKKEKYIQSQGRRIQDYWKDRVCDIILNHLQGRLHCKGKVWKKSKGGNELDSVIPRVRSTGRWKRQYSCHGAGLCLVCYEQRRAGVPRVA